MAQSTHGGRRDGAGRRTQDDRGPGRDVVLYLRSDQLAWLRAEAERLGLRSASRVVSDWIDRTRRRREPGD